MTLLQHSVFYDALFPEQTGTSDTDHENFSLRRRIRHGVSPSTILFETPLIVFDTETTGLDTQVDRIIEFGAIKYLSGKPIEEFWSFVRTDIELNQNIQSITGITQDMIKDAPMIDQVLPDFLKFIRGGILVAHNAEFDMGMLNSACGRLGYDLEWPSFCTVKLCRRILPGLMNYKLDTVAEHFGLTFEARHRAVGDVKVLAGIINSILEDDEFDVTTWSDVADSVIT
ncbi:MAG: exonuclease domain-containing protein [Proteobacteria bacterium]|nr:exonuclease domain-containing protein [Pseudomonadota bacterium]